MRELADTRAWLEVEDWIRREGLPSRFGHGFEKRFLIIGTKDNGSPATHEFDAVSVDGSVVASVKALSGKTAGGKYPVGKAMAAYTELLFLSLVKAREKYLVFTDREFYELFSRKSDGKRPEGVKLLYVQLPQEITGRLAKARERASEEMSPSNSGRPQISTL